MQSRRLEMVILSAPRILEAVRRIVFGNSEKITHFNKQFLPLLRYHNPKLEVQWQGVEENVLVEFSDGAQREIATESLSAHSIAQAILDADREKATELLALRSKKS